MFHLRTHFCAFAVLDKSVLLKHIHTHTRIKPTTPRVCAYVMYINKATKAIKYTFNLSISVLQCKPFMPLSRGKRLPSPTTTIFQGSAS